MSIISSPVARRSPPRADEAIMRPSGGSIDFGHFHGSGDVAVWARLPATWDRAESRRRAAGTSPHPRRASTSPRPGRMSGATPALGSRQFRAHLEVELNVGAAAEIAHSHQLARQRLLGGLRLQAGHRPAQQRPGGRPVARLLVPSRQVRQGLCLLEPRFIADGLDGPRRTGGITGLDLDPREHVQHARSPRLGLGAGQVDRLGDDGRSRRRDGRTRRSSGRSRSGR